MITISHRIQSLEIWAFIGNSPRTSEENWRASDNAVHQEESPRSSETLQAMSCEYSRRMPRSVTDLPSLSRHWRGSPLMLPISVSF